MTTLVARLITHLDLLVLGNHLMDHGPTETTTEFSNDNVAVTQEINVKVNMADGLARYVNLRDVRWQPGHDLRNRCDLERSANDNNKVYLVAIVLGESSRELIRQSLAKESDIRLHDTGSRNVVLGFIGAFGAPTSSLLLRTCRTLALRLTTSCAQRLNAAWASGDFVGLDLWENDLSLALVAALNTGSCSKRAVALNELVLGNTGLDFKVIDVLRVVCQQLPLLIEHGNELVSRRVSVSAREDVLGH